MNPASAAQSFAWSSPRAVSTRNGLRHLRVCPLDADCPGWVAWRHDKEAVKRLRFGVGKAFGDSSGWEMTHWGETPEQFDEDFAALLALLGDAARADDKAREAQRIDFVAEDYAPLTTAAAARLYDWQKPSCQRLVAALRRGNALDASQTGSGKTFVALAACAELGLTPFVIAPLAVLESWRRASRFMGVPLGDVSNWDKARCGSTPFVAKRKPEFRGQRMFAFAPRPGAGTLFESAAPDGEFRPVLVLDECQRAKSATSLQGRLLQDVSLQGAKVLCLSATAAKDPTEMHGLGLALGLHEGGRSFSDWANRHGCRHGSGGLQFTTNARAAADIMQRIHRVIFPAKGTRVRSADVPGYPENNVAASLVSNGEIVSAYGEMNDSLNEIEAKVAGNVIDRREAKAQGLAAIMKARCASERGKLDYMIEQVRELVADGFQVPVFLNFREHLRIMQRELKLTPEPIWGTAWLGFAPDGTEINGPAQKPEDRTRIIDDFQEGRQKVVLVSLQAGGAGISLHDVNGLAPRHSLISPSYSAIDLVQAIGRVWRAGSHSKATQSVVYAAGTIEEEIAASVTAKISQIETLNDGDLLPDCLAHFVGLEGEVKP